MKTIFQKIIGWIIGVLLFIGIAYYSIMKLFHQTSGFVSFVDRVWFFISTNWIIILIVGIVLILMWLIFALVCKFKVEKK